MSCVSRVALSHGGRRVFALGVVLLAGGLARADEPAAPVAAGDVAPVLAKAKKALAAKRWRDAKRAAEQALSVDAANVDAKAALGLADKGLGDCKGARAPLDAAFVGKAGGPGVAGAPAPCLGDKTADKHRLAVARLAAARVAAGAGRVAEARGLYDAALGAALLTLPIEREVPDDTSADASATPTTTEAPPPAAPAEPTPAEAEAAAGRARAEAEAARAEEAKEAVKQEEERRSVAPSPAAPVVVVASAPPPAPAPPLAFQVGIRTASSAKDVSGVHHPDDAGLMFTWLTFAEPYSRAAVVVDLESTRWRSAREDTMNRGATAFYGLGLDWSVPLVSRGNGLVLGAEVMGGLLQSTAGDAVSDGLVAQLMPHAGVISTLGNVGVFLDAGWRFQLLRESSLGQASEAGFVFQGGLRVEMRERESPPLGLDVGYSARFYAPNGSNIYTRYGGLPLTSSKGPLLGHELTLTTGERAPPGAQHGLAVTYLGSARGSGPSLEMIGLGYVFTQHAFRTRQLLNPYLGAQLGAVLIVSDDPATFSGKSELGVVGTRRAGLDVDVARRVLLRAGFSYDAVGYTNDVANGSLSGYAVEAGAIIRL